jgi:hypothetical protein
MDFLYLDGVEDRVTMHWKIELHAKFWKELWKVIAL